MKAYTLGLYEKSMPNTLTWKEKLLEAREAGFDFVEISIDETAEDTTEDTAEAEETVKAEE